MPDVHTNSADGAPAAEYTVNYSNDSLLLYATISGNSNLTHAGSGILILDKENTATGVLTISTKGASVQFGNGGNDDAVWAGSITGAGNVIVDTQGSLNLTKAYSYTGTTTITNGTLKLTDNGSVGTGAVTIKNSSVLEVANTSTANEDGEISTAEFSLSTATLETNASVQIGANTSLAATSISGGTLNLNGGTLKGVENGTTVSSATTLNADSSIDTSDGNVEISGAVSASNNTLAVEGENTLTLSGQATPSAP